MDKPGAAKPRARTHWSFLIMIPMKSFYCYEKVSILMRIWINGKSLMNNHCLKKKNFIAIEIWRILQMQITCMQKEFVKTTK